MALRSEDPPAPGHINVETPPASDKPTTAMLKADIDSGRTGDKIAHYDPGLSQLGTDDEAAGNTPSYERVALARRNEAASPQVRKAGQSNGKSTPVMPFFIGAAALIPIIIGVALYLLK